MRVFLLHGLCMPRQSLIVLGLACVSVCVCVCRTCVVDGGGFIVNIEIKSEDQIRRIGFYRVTTWMLEQSVDFEVIKAQAQDSAGQVPCDVPASVRSLTRQRAMSNESG